MKKTKAKVKPKTATQKYIDEAIGEIQPGHTITNTSVTIDASKLKALDILAEAALENAKAIQSIAEGFDGVNITGISLV